LTAGLPFYLRMLCSILSLINFTQFYHSAQKPGGVAILERGNRHVYYLVSRIKCYMLNGTANKLFMQASEHCSKKGHSISQYSVKNILVEPFITVWSSSGDLSICMHVFLIIWFWTFHHFRLYSACNSSQPNLVFILKNCLPCMFSLY